MKTKKGNEVKTIPKSYAVSDETRNRIVVAKYSQGFKTYEELFRYLLELHEKQN